VGTYNVFEAARRAGVRRVIYASSGATVSDWERDEPYAALVGGRYDQVAEWPILTHESPTRPHGALRLQQDLGRGPRPPLRGHHARSR